MTALLLGSNMGNRYLWLMKAIDQLQQRAGTVEVISPIYETEPWGKSDQEAFLNCALIIQTKLSPDKLMDTILDVEKSLGRQRLEKWEARTIDIDILFYDEEVINRKDLTIPHPLLQERRFALAPLNDLMPGFVHPVLKSTIHDLYINCQDEGKVRIYKVD